MELIVFDLEWNIGYQPKLFDYHGSQLTFRGEIIQIGAVKVNEKVEILDTFSMTLKPRIFRKLQHHIAAVTGLSQGELDAGVPEKEGLTHFMEWAGPEAVFAEWGLDDVPVLKQNLYLCGLDETQPTQWYDLQRVFLAQYPRKEGEGMTLESVVDRLGIAKEAPFHNALEDALYTVAVCKKLRFMDGLEAYPREDALLREALCIDTKAQYYDFKTYFGRLFHDDYKTEPELFEVRCPVCGRPLKNDTVWLKRGNTGYYTQADCAVCGPWFLRFKLSRKDGLHWNFARCLEAPRPETQAKWEKQRAQFIARSQKKSERPDSESALAEKTPATV